MGILIFTVLPLLFMIPMAFTNYSTINKHLTLFDWVGLANFKTVLGLGGKIGKTFWRVLRIKPFCLGTDFLEKLVPKEAIFLFP